MQHKYIQYKCRNLIQIRFSKEFISEAAEKQQETVFFPVELPEYFSHVNCKFNKELFERHMVLWYYMYRNTPTRNDSLRVQKLVQESPPQRPRKEYPLIIFLDRSCFQHKICYQHCRFKMCSHRHFRFK